MKKSTFTKIYFPGLISLAFLPMICLGYFIYELNFGHKTGVEVAFADDEYFKRINFNIRDFERTSTKFEISSNASENKLVIKELNARFKEIGKAKRYHRGITVKLQDDITYQDFVNLIDLGTSFNIPFAPYKNKIFFAVPRAPLKPIVYLKTISCGTTTYQGDLSYLRSLTITWKYLVGFWPSSIPFLLMIFFSVRSKRCVPTERL